MTVTPKDAATIIILRRPSRADRNDFEVLMALRSPRSAFVPSSHVFPGGRMDDDDCDEDMWRFVGEVDRAAIDCVCHGSEKETQSLGIWIAAVRETFEEVGLLIASPRGESRLVSFNSPERKERYRAYRDALRSRRMTMQEILEREDLTIALDRLHYFAHWITPVLSPIRYDTRFFVTAVPPGQEACHDGDEMTGHRWITPRAALEGYHQKRFHMVVPTIVTLEQLCRFDTVDEVIASTRGKVVTSVLTRLVIENDEIQEHAPDGRVFRNLVPPR